MSRGALAAALAALACFGAAQGARANGQALAIQQALERVPLHDPQPLHLTERRQIVLEVYARLGGLPAWFRGPHPTPAARDAVASLARLADRGLDAADYHAAAWASRLDAAGAGLPSDEVPAEADVALTRDLAHAACDLLLGRIPPTLAGAEYGLADEDVDVAGVLLGIARDGGAEEALDGLEPLNPQPRRLRAALARYRELAERWGDGAPIDPGTVTLRPGDSSPALASIAALLASLGDLAPGDEAAAARSPYGPELEAAVRRFQERHGLEVDAAIGHETRAALRVPLSQRARQVELTLECWRWLPRRIDPPFVVINVPAFQLSAFEPGDDGPVRALSMRVIVGRQYEGRRTPLLSSRFTEITFSPWWEAPPRLAREELVPMLRRDPGRGEAEGYVVERAGEQLPLSAESLALVRSRRARIRQRPGPDNLLGGVRFTFPNNFLVYLHGTPARSLFERSERALSHGCIRVEDPVGLALHALRDDPSWTRERVEAAMASGEPSSVPLPGEPVLIVYGTASVREDGVERFHRDVYGLDARLEDALAGRLVTSAARDRRPRE